MDYDRYVFGTHSYAEIEHWAISLHYFRFCRAYGGHSNDGDQFLVALRYDGETGLLDLLKQLGVTPERVPIDNPKPIPGVPYSADQFSRFVSTIKELPTVKQPGHQDICGQRAFLWAEDGKLTISIHDINDPYEVSEESFSRAKRIEEVIVNIDSRIIDPPRDSKHCICPKYYPEIWESAQPGG
jgi:hypothetical protein